MRRIAAGIAVSLLAALVIGAPAASARPAGPAALTCGAPAPPPEACRLLDDLAARLGPVNALLGRALAPLTGPALGVAARSDQPAGVPTADVVRVSEDLLEQLNLLPEPLQRLLGPQLDGLTTTVRSLVDQLTAPATGGQQAAGASTPTPAKTTTSARSAAAPHSGSTSSLGGSTSTSSSPSSTSSATMPDIPVGDPLVLAPLGPPDFGSSPPFEPVMEPMASDATQAAQEAAHAEAVDPLPQPSGKTELAVVIALSLLLIVGAGIAQLRKDRHTIAG